MIAVTLQMLDTSLIPDEYLSVYILVSISHSCSLISLSKSSSSAIYSNNFASFGAGVKFFEDAAEDESGSEDDDEEEVEAVEEDAVAVSIVARYIIYQ